MPHFIKYLLPIILLFSSCLLLSQSTMGLQQYDNDTENGYVLFSPVASKNTYLINKCGKEVHSWLSAYRPGQAAYLLSNGDLMRAGFDLGPFYNIGGKGGFLERLDWNSNVVWSVKISDYYNCLHHDFKVMPNGNILALEWSEVPLSVAFAKGRNPALVSTWIWTEKVVELKPVGTDSAFVIWEWNLFDHLVQDFDSTKSNYGVVSQLPQLVNFNYVPDATTPDWVHLNAIDYNAKLDQIMLTANTLSEVWIIDHSTTTAEAATHAGGNSGKGGDLLYRWGNPATYSRGDTTNQQLFHPHNGQWIKSGLPNEGKVLLFNNGVNRPGGEYSSVDIINTNIDTTNNSYSIDSVTSFLPLSPAWTYSATIPSDFYSSYISGAQQLRNGGFNICSGALGKFFEIDSSKNKNWEYINPVNNLGPMTQGDTLTLNNVFRCNFYYPDDSAFASVTLTAGNEIEINPIVPSICDLAKVEEISDDAFSIFPNPSTGLLFIDIGTKKDFKISIVNVFGQTIHFTMEQNGNVIVIDLSTKVSGIYFLIYENKNRKRIEKIIRQ